MANNTTEVEFRKGRSEFKLIGTLVLNDKTFTLNSKSKGGYISNRAYIGINCGNGNIVHAKMFGGYFENKDTKIYVNGKKKDEKFGNITDDYKNRFEVDWKNRFQTQVLEQIGPSCFTSIGLEWTKKNDKDVVDSTYFLTQYDAIKFLHDELEKMTDEQKTNLKVIVKGNMEYSYYNNEVNVSKNITSIKVTNLGENSFGAQFMQTSYINKNNIGEKDDVTETVAINVVVPEYINKVDGISVKRNVPLKMPMYLRLSSKARKIILERFFKSEEGYGRYELIGTFEDVGNTEKIDLSNYSDDVRALLESGDWDEDEATPTASSNNKNVEDMLITNIRKIRTISSNGIPCDDIARESDVYTVSELDTLYTQFLSDINPEEDDEDDDLPFDLDTDLDDEDEFDEDNEEDTDWLSSFAE